MDTVLGVGSHNALLKQLTSLIDHLVCLYTDRALLTHRVESPLGLFSLSCHLVGLRHVLELDKFLTATILLL